MPSRSFDWAALNDLANHPTIRPHAGGDGKSWIELKDFIEDSANHFLKGEHGGLLFHWTAPDVYEVHIMVLPAGRGEWAMRFGQEGLDYMKDEGARQLWARIPETNRHTMLYARRMGFTERGRKTFDCGPARIFDWRY